MRIYESYEQYKRVPAVESQAGATAFGTASTLTIFSKL